MDIRTSKKVTTGYIIYLETGQLQNVNTKHQKEPCIEELVIFQEVCSSCVGQQGFKESRSNALAVQRMTQNGLHVFSITSSVVI